MKEKSKIIALIGKCATGKTYYSLKLAKHPNVNRIISYTTRPRRDNETDGVDYHFLSDDEFDSRLKTETVYEQTEYIVDGKRFRYSTCSGVFSDNKINVMVINPHGLKQLIENEEIKKRLLVVHITADLKTRIERYLSREDKNNDDNKIYKRLTERLLQDEKDFEELNDIIKKEKIEWCEISNNDNDSVNDSTCIEFLFVLAQYYTHHKA